MKIIKNTLIAIIVSLLSPLTFASESSGAREILNMGCHLNDGTCYVTISGSAVGPEQCSSTSVRWSESSSANGKNTLALLTAAFMSGKQVIFNIVDSCYGVNYPTFNYMSIYR